MFKSTKGNKNMNEIDTNKEEDTDIKEFEECINLQKNKIDNLVEKQIERETLANKKDKNHNEATQNYKNSIDSLFEEHGL